MALGGIVFAAVMTVAIGRGDVAQAQERYSVWDGVYQEEQAARGKDEYEYNCGSCHIHDLTGDSIKDMPALAGEDFLCQVGWEDGGGAARLHVDEHAGRQPRQPW